MKFFLIFSLLLTSFCVHAQKVNERSTRYDTAIPGHLGYQITLLQDGTYGYDIIKDSHRFIHQTSIPGRQGNQGFKNKADAEKVASLVIDKIRKGEMPPTVSTHEMDSLKIDYRH